MESYETNLSIGVAIVVGLVIGLEREQSHPSDTIGKRYLGGVRTYPIVALVGALAAMLAPITPWFPLVALGGVVALVAISYANGIHERGEHGVTTEASVLATFLLGAVATSHVIEPVSDRLLVVAMIGVALTFLLSSKQWFHATLAKVSRADFYATVKFLIVAVIVLPLLPHRGLGPWHALDPFQVGLMVVTIAGLSFVGYVASRWLGARRGLVLGAALGGLVSSTAVTLSFAKRAMREPQIVRAAAGAIGIAWLVMVARVAVLIAIVDFALLGSLLGPLAALAAGCAVGTLVVSRGAHAPAAEGATTAAAAETVTLANPFELGSAIRLGLVFGGVTMATKAATVYLGDQGLYLASALAGTTDVDAITVSTAKLAHGGLTADAATTAIIIAIAVNTIVKTAFAFASGSRAIGARVAVIGATTMAGGALGVAAAYVFG